MHSFHDPAICQKRTARKRFFLVNTRSHTEFLVSLRDDRQSATPHDTRGTLSGFHARLPTTSSRSNIVSTNDTLSPYTQRFPTFVKRSFVLKFSSFGLFSHQSCEIKVELFGICSNERTDCRFAQFEKQETESREFWSLTISASWGNFGM